MPCLIYKPTQGLTIAGAGAYASGLTRELCFKMGTPQIEIVQNKTEEFAMSGRPCITKQMQRLKVGVTAINQHVKDKPQWLEFILSTACGEPFDLSQMYCLNAYKVRGQGSIIGTPKIALSTRRNFVVTFEVTYWEFG